jgi:hypothetical protein
MEMDGGTIGLQVVLDIDNFPTISLTDAVRHNNLPTVSPQLHSMVGPGYWPFIVSTSRDTPSGANVPFWMLKVY